jgi:dihydroxyacetone kinase-like protein
MGVALTSCTVPALGRPTFELGADEIEMGVGIHGEQGRRRMALSGASGIVATLADAIAADLPLDPARPILLHVNGFGGTPLVELYLVYDIARRYFEAKSITIARSLVGNYTTSLDMAGCSLTVTLLDEELLELWDAPVLTPALRWGC